METNETTMPTNKLPVLGGGERGLCEGDFVRLENGWTVGPLYLHDGKAIANYDGSTARKIRNEGEFAFWFIDSGKCWGDETGLDIVLILGPESVDNGDGTATKLCTLPVTMMDCEWRVGVPIAVRGPKDGDLLQVWDSPAHGHTFIAQVTGPFGAQNVVYRGPRLILSPHPAPRRSYKDKLVEAVKAGVCQLPLIDGAELQWEHSMGNTGSWGWRLLTPHPSKYEKQVEDWPQVLGPLPPREEGDEEVVYLREVRELINTP